MGDDNRTAWGYGIATISTANQTVLDTWYPTPALGAPPVSFDSQLLPAQFGHLEGADEARGIQLSGVTTTIDLDVAADSTPDAYLRLHVLSHGLALPNSINLEGIFSHLPVVAFTTRGPVEPSFYEENRIPLQRHGAIITSLDRFGPLLNYYTPPGVRIADASRVRLGAHLSPGTTVMHEGFVNFNASTLGASMVEGRIAQGVIVGEGTDIGGGASIMGTLSGGGKDTISIGQRCLLGANSGVGISLGDDCVVEAGLYVTAGTKVMVLRGDGPTQVKARELSGQPGLLYRRNSLTGAVEVIPRTGQGVELNKVLHV
jgi:2,3,4,5-tetrahydropyridine-2-carboxylate N-succinyltransferase